MEKSNAATVAICDTGPLIHHPCSVFPLPSSILHFPFCAFRSPPSVLGLLFSIFRRPFCAIRYPFSAFRPPSSVSSPPPSALRPLLSALCSLALRHSAFRNPHSTLEKFRIPHSAFRTYPRTFVRSYAFSLHHSAFRICHWKGPFVRLCSFRPQSPPPPAPLQLFAPALCPSAPPLPCSPAPHEPFLTQRRQGRKGKHKKVLARLAIVRLSSRRSLGERRGPRAYPHAKTPVCVRTRTGRQRAQRNSPYSQR